MEPRLCSDFNLCITVQDDPQKLVPLLQAQLPHSIPLLRRLQHNLAFPSSTARLLTTFSGVDPPASSPWLAAYVDLARGRETQMTIYSSVERASSAANADTVADGTGINISTVRAPPETLAHVRAQLLALLSFTKTALLSEYLASLETDKVAGTGTARVLPNTPGHIPPPPPQAFLIGNLHTGLLALLKASGNYTDPQPVPGVRIHRYDNNPYIKYLFRGAFVTDVATNTKADPNAINSQNKVLPPGYRFHDRYGRIGVLPHHYDLIRARTHLPRSNETLSRIPGLAVYVDQGQPRQPQLESRPDVAEDEDGRGNDTPIAWAFLGLDGSLATLFVEPEHRGKGLAELLSREVMRRGMAEGGIWRKKDEGGDEAVWVHANVLATNGASRRVLGKLGGEVGWTVTWTVVEV
ncbi:acetyltransferase, GNAT family [Aspergillus clavatus NRRL 1]|uniref:Acetyltransferase, GNAT family family n=1 Tax=Aspergillus clavatus (strain ATCC 1007 / CBS 513.65 / DSM 816 / NCTC 3887 / NRRL 1 / QM 1276 / 107) TaxID=344612 RepID=A1CJP4_ASPCL|nr:acetyltransferase, GNAT family [Aspergillus clavatus NRRL 1]EAW09368.1 acetyltransferase, GNAT family family [Aspergillus clavatus NRRL 1]